MSKSVRALKNPKTRKNLLPLFEESCKITSNENSHKEGKDDKPYDADSDSSCDDAVVDATLDSPCDPVNEADTATEVSPPVVDSTSTPEEYSNNDEEIAAPKPEESDDEDQSVTSDDSGLNSEDSDYDIENVYIPKIHLRPYYDNEPFPDGFVEVDISPNNMFYDTIEFMRSEGFVIYTGKVGNFIGEPLTLLMGIQSVKKKYNSMNEVATTKLPEDVLNCVNTDMGAFRLAVELFRRFFSNEM